MRPRLYEGPDIDGIIPLQGRAAALLAAATVGVPIIASAMVHAMGM